MNGNIFDSDNYQELIEDWNDNNKSNKVKNYLDKNGRIKHNVKILMEKVIRGFFFNAIGKAFARINQPMDEVHRIVQLSQEKEIIQVTFLGKSEGKEILSNPEIIKWFILPMIQQISTELLTNWNPDDRTRTLRYSLQEYFNRTYISIDKLKEIGFPPKFFKDTLNIEKTTWYRSLDRARKGMQTTKTNR